jgi:phosphoribosylaminoimidazolecarboxamide formyltransferase/IMP cyclohydrolase
VKVKNALISVSDKIGLVEFARALHKLKINLISTGGTAKVITDSGIPVEMVSDLTGYSEMLDDRVKTLHPVIHGGILALREKAEHMKRLEELKIKPIDLVVVNLYPFQKTISKDSATVEEAIENIDVGGPALIRAAAKNYHNVGVIVHPGMYSEVADELSKNGCMLSSATLSRLAVEAFQHTAEYDSAIYNYFGRKITQVEEFPELLNLTYSKIQNLRYGENPYQKAAFYREPHIDQACISNSTQLQGKELSFNNILDLNEALELVKDFELPTAAVIKHTNPCGVACAEDIYPAYRTAHETDPTSAFGSIVALNRKVPAELAEFMKQFFVEAVIAPGYEAKALEILKEKKNLRVIETKSLERKDTGFDLKKVVGGLLVQTRHIPKLSEKDMKVISKRKPTNEEIKAMLFAFKVCCHTKSNSIIFAKENVTTGIGAGQMSRVDSVKIAAMKSNGKSLGSVMASDAFFPFRDGIDEAAKAGVTAVVQPGGSIRDQEVIDAVNEHGMAMVFTGVRCFKH